MEDRMEKAKEIVESMDKDKDLNEIEEWIKDNRITFIYNDKNYRVHLLSISEKEELDKLRRKKFNSMLQEKDEKDNFVYLFSKDLIRILKDRGIDIEKDREELQKLQSMELDLQKKLGEALANNEGDSILQNYRELIKTNQFQQSIIETNIILLLECSFENTLEEYTYKIITYISSEVLEDGIWKRLFSSMEEFENCKEDELIIELGKRAIPIQYYKK